MLSPGLVLGAFLVYCALLFAVAWSTERAASRGRKTSDHPVVYSLTLAVYCTSWTYYGSVGKAATSGLLFLAIYLGPTACIVLWWLLLRKLARLKETHHITSIADLISARYDRSLGVAALATLIAMLGIVPYLALQFKSLAATFRVITGETHSQGFLGHFFGPLMLCLLAVFTIYFGARRLDPTERHRGMVMALAVECVVKLFAFLAVGVFVTYGLFDGFGDVLTKAIERGFSPEALPGPPEVSQHLVWITYMVLSASAILFLPRQFHVAVIENSGERNILTAMWLFPLYMLLINLFVLPLAAAGVALGLPVAQADTFVLTLPLGAGNTVIALLVFLGGFSAATGMVIVATMTVSTMITNHFLAPLAEILPALAPLRRHLLKCRWAAILSVLLLGYAFDQAFGQSYMLVNMGILSFAAVFQFAPVLLGGLFWPRANRVGALAGLTGGLLVWAYTLILPLFVREGFFDTAILESGPWGLAWLHPERLFGLTVLDPLSHGAFWSFFLNTGLFVAGSVLFDQRPEERRLAEEFVNCLQPPAPERPYGASVADIPLAEKLPQVRALLLDYFDPRQAEAILVKCQKECGITGSERVSVVDLVQFYGLVESHLAGAMGTAGAHRVFGREGLLSKDERAELSRAYAGILADMKLSPLQLRGKVDYYREREALLVRTSSELEEKIRERDAEIAERRRVEQTLRASEERQRLLLEASPEPIVTYDTEGRLTYTNPAYVDAYGWTREELLGKAFVFSTPKEDREAASGMFDLLLREGKILSFETRHLTKDGRILDVLLSAATLTDSEGRLTGFIVFHRDMTEKKRAEEMLKRLAAAVEQAAEIVVITDTAGRVQYVNPAFTGLTDVTLPALESLSDLQARVQFPTEFAEAWGALGEGKAWKGSLGFTRADGSRSEVECTASPVRDEEGHVVNYVAVCRDVTVQKRIENHLQQSQKMDAIGTLAGGIAHDFNNILQPLLGYAELARRQPGLTPQAAEYIQNILNAALRARALVGQILAFSRRAEQERAPVVLQSLAAEALQLLRASLPSSVEIHSEMPQADAVVLADANQLNQVLINLCANAAYAMKEGGTLTVRLETREVDPDFAERNPGLKPGRYAVLAVSDTGSGIAPETLPHIFEPFFTTKPKGEGTGLGLSVVHGIVENHGGAILVRSAPGKGSTFEVFLPVHEGVSVAPPQAVEPRGAAAGEEILFVDDEAPIRELAAEALEQLGYRVSTAKNAAEALEIFSREPQRFQVVITDYTMPGMKGPELAGKLQELRPGLPVLLCSGYTPGLSPEQLAATGIRQVLRKPLTIKELATAIEASLAG